MDCVSKTMDLLEARYVPRRRPTLRRTSEETPDAFKILIACLLSLRTTDINTERATKKLFAEAQTLEKIAAMHSEKLEKLIYSSGHYKRKAMILKSVSKELIERFNSEVPKTKEELMSIKYVGPKTANIVLAFVYGKEVIPVDTHLHRIPNRFGWVKTKKPEETEQELYKILPRKYWKEANTVLILFGKEICQPVSPWCSKCPVRDCCVREGVVRSR